MTREIKFRVWQGKRKSFFFTRLIEWFLYRPENYLGELPEISVDSNIQESTSLKDSNGKEIYEGDILAYDNSKNDRDWKSGDSNSRYFEVIFKDGAFYTLFKWFDYITYNADPRKRDKVNRERTELLSDILAESNDDGDNVKIFYKIVGNIFENPELLK